MVLMYADDAIVMATKERLQKVVDQMCYLTVVKLKLQYLAITCINLYIV